MLYNKDVCPCKRTKCERYKNCDACMQYHHSSKRKYLTVCERMKLKAERKNRKCRCER